MTRRIFRESALRRYNERLERVEIPRYATMPWTRLGWALALLLLLVAALLQSVRLPVYAEGPGIVISSDGPSPDATVAALLPAVYATQLQRGQSAQITMPTEAGLPAGPLRASVDRVETAPLSPAEARRRYGLDAAAGSLIEGPIAIAFISLDRPAALWAGTVAEVQIQVGTRSALALLPGISLFFAGEPDVGTESERGQ